MRIWTVLLSLVVMAALAVDASAQRKGGKGGGTRPAPIPFEQMAGEDKILTETEFIDARVKAAPTDADKEQAKTRAEGMWKRLVDTKCGKEAGGKTTFDADQYKAAMAKVMEEMKSKFGGKKKGA